ncbi:carboxylic ester hydrolase [Cnuibacter physcomitrellae]|uniref:Carboxylic ester hydrolase n=1 Tax=Cnuibacter physcomitrellae TaxID=1619308 RepID=A0A1X9LI30_9MICO|nr:carboxylesterase/lipase family protein [Cnuibacter physcomitrellae]ARJ04787.1 carboxylesterase [Cnuibacter physcomitrellae]GGI41881.1 carboxylic ester hydrolase [Cnuibacter physcomitrellae]
MTTLSPDALVVETSSGALRGITDGTVRSWRGIPYAAPPVGALRFLAPRPVEPWSGVRDAVAFGHASVQSKSPAVRLPADVSMSEDCLTLNVTAPAEHDGPLPVMVWIHGGAYFAGSSAQALYDPAHLVAEGVVVVTVNYRLGALGFLDLSSLSSGAATFDSNPGLRDQLAALRWVQDEIAAFGGDPGDVTLFGESAGGGCVTTLLTSPAAAGLFHRAIAQSSPATSVYSAERAARVARRFLDVVGIDADRPELLRERAAESLADAAFALIGDVARDVPGTLALAPVVDGDIVPVHPIEAYSAGTQLPVPLIIGTNRDEASLFKLMKSPLMPVTEASVAAMFEELAAEQPDLGDAAERIEGAYPHYPRRRTPSELSRDAGFRMPSIWLATAHSRVAPTRMYRFDHATPMLKLLGIGATHGAELAYVWGNFEVAPKDPTFRLGGRKEAHRLSESIRHRWTAFASSGTPSAGEGAPEWPLYDESTRSTLIFDRGETVVDDPDAEVRSAWGDEVIGFS